MKYVLRSLLLLFWVAALAPAAHPQPRKREPSPPPNQLYQVIRRDEKSGEKKIGFIDNAGKLVIGFDLLPKTTIAVGEFHEGRAVIYLKKKEGDENVSYTGYIDQTGKVIIAPRFSTARDFSEGLAYVEAKGFHGFINRQGKAVIKVKDYYVNDFHEGLAAVGGRDGIEWGYIDRSGRIAIKRQYRFADNFSEGLAGVLVAGKYGFINQNGDMVIPPRFEPRRGPYLWNGIVGTSRFSEGLASVATDYSYGLYGLYGYINKKGDFVVPPQFHTAQDFSEGLALVVIMDERTKVVKRVGWIDKSGQWLVTEVKGRIPSSEFPKTFPDPNGYLDWGYSEGLVPFLLYSEGKTLRGYMDQRGEVVVQPTNLNKVGPFRGGIARASFYVKGDPGSEEDYGYIDKSGRFIWRSK